MANTIVKDLSLSLFDIKTTYTYSEKDFSKEGIWICHFLREDAKLAYKYVQYRIDQARSNAEILEFLYASRVCLKHHLDISSFQRLNNTSVSSTEHNEEMIAECKIALAKTNALIEFILECEERSYGEQVSRNYDYTNSQWVLIFHYGYRYVGVVQRRSSDVTQLAKLMHLLIGKKITKIQNSDLYNKMLKAPDFKSSKSLVKDLGIVRKLFKEYDIKDVVKEIDNQIDKSNKEMKDNLRA